jgi:transcriptional regulator with XRE-family HTH domain
VEIGESIRRKRIKKFWTQARLAFERITQKMLSKIETNEVVFRFSTILKIAGVLDIEPSQLVDAQQPPA